jgi:hypothetical protein
MLSLGGPIAKRANAKLQHFINDWQTNVSDTDLAHKYELKIPMTDPSCRRLDIRQIRFANKIRAYFTIIDEQQMTGFCQ